MATEAVYRSSHPAVIEWWDGIHEARVAFGARCDEIAARFPGFHAVVNEKSTGGASLAGITGYEDDSVGWKTMLPPPSPAWRLMSNDLRYYKPYRNHLKDPALIELFQGVNWKMPLPPGGMPLEVMVQGRWFTPGMRRDDDDGPIWYSWGVGFGYIDGTLDVSFREATEANVDHDMWEPVKLSEFYAAQGK